VKFLVEWLEDAENAALEERATNADVRIFLADANVTQHLFDGELSDHITASLYGVAHGLVHDWWSIFGSRDREFSLRKYRSGYIIPDVNFHFDGAVFEVQARQHTYRNPDVRFWGGFTETMSREEGEAFLSAIIEQVLARLADAGLKSTSVALRWKRVQASRGTEEEAFCEAAGSLALDPYSISDEMTAFIEHAERLFEREPLIEFAAGAKDVKAPRLIDWVERMRRHKGFQYRLADLKAAAASTAAKAPARKGEEAWSVGYRRAREMRATLSCSTSHRFRSFRDVASIFGAGKAYSVAPPVDGIRALRSERADGIQIHVRDHGRSGEAPAAQLFSIARAIGDVVCFPETEIAPINDVHNAYRQAAGRAFAAEFLAPIDEITSMLDDQHDVVTIANEFSVSTTVVERQIENCDRIREACAA
jgi:hypothetical protein